MQSARHWLLLTMWALLGLTTGHAQSPQVRAVWDRVDGQNHETAIWELEVDGVVLACPTGAVTATTRECGPVAVTVGTHSFRLRGLTPQGEAGEWSPAVGGTIGGPGLFTIRAVIPGEGDD